MNMIECLGLEAFTKDEDTFFNFIGDVCEGGEAIVGYYGYPYINREYGKAQFIARTELNEEKTQLEFSGLDTHISGLCVWEVMLSEMNLQPKDADPLARRVMVKRASDGGGMAVVNLVNADVLPSFLENDRVKMQMVAFPEDIHYYPDEDAYAKDQPEAANGKKWLLADGSMMASGLLINHSLDNPDKDKDHFSDNYMMIRGTVKQIRKGIVKFGEEEFPSFISTVIGTEHGDLEIAHSADQVEEAERDYLKVGSTVWGTFILSGDVAIYEYEKGIVRDEEHNLALLRYTLQGGDPKRLGSVLREDAVYVSEGSKAEFRGRKAIIDRLQLVRDANPGKKYYAHRATITEHAEGADKLPYAVGQRCVVLAEDDENDYTAIAFLELDAEGYITKVTISREPNYCFQVDKPNRPKNILDDLQIPESVAEPMLARARFHGFLDEEMENETVLSLLDRVNTYEDNAVQLLKDVDRFEEIEEKDRFANLFAYLFAKSIEADYSSRHGEERQFRFVVNYNSPDAFTGEFHTPLTGVVEQKLRTAHHYGRQFYKDVDFFCTIHKQCDFQEELMKALVIVQQIGEVYAKAILEAQVEASE